MTTPPPFGARLEDVEVRFGRSGAPALDGATCEIPAGAITGLLGRNGAGKTTLLSLLGAFRRPTSGTVRVGPPGQEEDPWENAGITSGVQVVREGGDVSNEEKVSETLKLYADLRLDWDAEYAGRLLDLFEVDVTMTPGALSLGKRSALGAVIGLASRAPLTVFDEVYLGMDAPTRYAFYDELLQDYAEHPRTIVVSSHLVEEVERLFEHVVLLHRGTVLLAEPADTMRQRGVSLTGPADAVDRIAAGRRVLHRQQLGPTTQVTLEGALSDADRAAAAEQRVTVGAVPVQDLFVRLTSKKEER